MENVTPSFHFNLTMFGNIGHHRYPAFVLCLLLYVVIVCANIVIILVIAKERTLHEPMYIFVSCLSINSLYGSAAFFPRFLMDLLTDTHLISRPACFSQIYIIYSYASYELTILSVMAYDRYVAVCKPLHYHSKMSCKTALKLVVFAWTYPVFPVSVCLFLSVRLPLCGNKILKVFCGNWNVVKLACVDTVMNNIVGMLFTISTVFAPFTFVLYTYLGILRVCWKSSSEFKARVSQTCLPHIVTFVNYTIAVFCDISLSRLNLEKLNPVVAVILSLDFLVIPPILNPIMYGLKLSEIRRCIFGLFSRSDTFHG